MNTCLICHHLIGLGLSGRSRVMVRVSLEVGLLPSLRVQVSPSVNKYSNVDLFSVEYLV
jgi:hypothetical protein